MIRLPVFSSRGVIAAMLIVASIAVAPARPLNVRFASEYQADVWGLDEGFPENSCSGIVLGPDGYLWLGTFRGLVRFNGQQFRHWGPEAMPELARTSIVNLHRDRAGRVWFSTMEGLICNDGAKWTRWQENGGWLDRADYVRSYAEAPDGTLAFGRFSGKIMRRERDGFRELPPLPGVGGAWCAFDREGTLYAARAGFVGVLRDNAWQPLAGERDLGRRVLGLGTDRAGDALVLCRQEVLWLRGGQVTARLPLSAEINSFWELTVDASGNFWLPAVEAGLYRIRPTGEVKYLRKEDGLPHSGGTRVVYADEHDGIWIGSGVGGLARLRPKRFRYAGEAEGLGERVILTLAPLRDGRVLMTTYGAGPAYFDGERATRPPMFESREAAFVRTALTAHDDAVWLGTFSRGLLRFDGNTFTPFATEIFGANETIDTMFEDSQHRLWVGGEKHVAVGLDARFREVAMPESLQRRRPTLFAERRDGTVLLTKHHEIYAYTAAGLRAAPLVTLPADWRISALLVDSHDRVWIGTTAHGLAVFGGGKWKRFPAGAGLPDTTISSLVQDNTGKLWFGCGRAIVRADPEELWRVAQGQAEQAALQIFGPDDGLRELDLPYGTQPCVAKDDRGRLWFALIRGAAMIDPATLKLFPQAPPVIIESISYVPRGSSQPMELALNASTAPTRLPAGSRMIRINYAALDFIAPRKQQFRVRLDHDRWQDVHDDTSIHFLELPPGRHTVQVQAAGGDGGWNRTGAIFDFELTPFYWQTGWFRALLGLGLVSVAGGGAWVVSHLRVRRARESLARERRFAEIQDALRSLAMKLTESLEPEALGRAVGAASYALFQHDAFLLVVANPGDRIGICPYMEDTAEGESRPQPVTRAGHALTMSLAPVLDGTPHLLNRNPADPSRTDPMKLSPWGFVERRSLSLMFAPVLWNGHVTGAISVQSYTPYRYHEEDFQQLQILAAHCGAAIARLEAESSLRRNEERLRLAMQSARMGSWEINATSGTLLVSPDTERVYGCAAGALSGPAENLAALAPEPAATELRRKLRDLIEGRATELDFMHRIVAEGAERWVELKARRQQEPGDDARSRVVGVTADITARKLAELERAKLEEQLRQSQKLEAVGTLAGGIAHDFNNILTAIIGNAELASMDMGAQHPSREFLDAVKKSGLRARDLVRRILAFSRPRENRRNPTALLPAVEEVVNLLRATIPANVELTVEADPQLPLVEIDGTEIHQVLLNLGTNASHALGHRPGKVEFKLDTCIVRADEPRPTAELPAGLYVHVAVSDNGSGISPAILSRIFDPFFTTKQPGEGSGLGLSVAHGIMRANGGAITVQSSVGIGSTFHLYFPASTATGTAGAPTQNTAAAAPGHGERILYVDDETLLVAVVERLLSRAGYQPVGCTRPRDALKLFQENPASFALVVSDYSMPEMSGLELADAILRIRPEVGVILSTGYQRPGVAEAARELGVRAILNKTDTPTELVPMIAGMLARNATPSA